MKYTKASAEVVLFDNSDVITTSSGCEDQASFKKENPDGNWGCEDVASKVAGT